MYRRYWGLQFASLFLLGGMLTAFFTPESAVQNESITAYLKRMVNPAYLKNVIPPGHEFLVIRSYELAQANALKEYVELYELHLKRAQEFCEVNGYRGVFEQKVRFSYQETFDSGKVYVCQDGILEIAPALPIVKLHKKKV